MLACVGASAAPNMTRPTKAGGQGNGAALTIGAYKRREGWDSARGGGGSGRQAWGGDPCPKEAGF